MHCATARAPLLVRLVRRFDRFDGQRRPRNAAVACSAVEGCRRHTDGADLCISLSLPGGARWRGGVLALPKLPKGVQLSRPQISTMLRAAHAEGQAAACALHAAEESDR